MLAVRARQAPSATTYSSSNDGAGVVQCRDDVVAAQLEDGSLRGHIYFHLGDDSGFRAVRAKAAPKPEAETGGRDAGVGS